MNGIITIVIVVAILAAIVTVLSWIGGMNILIGLGILVLGIYVFKHVIPFLIAGFLAFFVYKEEKKK